jgi:hypothetical protein
VMSYQMVYRVGARIPLFPSNRRYADPDQV